jgi:coenzyme F420-reducing hydrogenase beta subunit
VLSFRDHVLGFDASRCTQCGACFAACRNGALSPETGRDGAFLVQWSAQACKLCAQCVRTCPASDLHAYPFRESDWAQCLAAFLGRARSHDCCVAASSGGVGRALIAHCLRTRYCDAAWCVTQKEDGEVQGTLLRGCDDVRQIATSVYRPFPVLANLPRLKPGTHLLLVGTNCQIRAAARFFKGSGVHILKVAILCKQQKTLGFTRFARRMLGVGEAGVVYYRGGGWPGEVHVGGSRAPFEHVSSLPLGKRLWCIPGCRLCPNPLGHAADLTLADPWGILNERSANGGATLVIVRTDAGRALLEDAGSEIALEPISIAAAKRSVDWQGILEKQSRQANYLDGPVPVVRRALFRVGELQRRTYELILGRYCPPRVLLRILNRLPYLG